MATACSPAGTALRSEILEWYERSCSKAYHEILGVPANCELGQLQTAFARLARRFHPDAVGSCDEDLRAQVQVVFMRINEAYQALRRRGPARPAAPPRPEPLPRAAARERTREASLPKPPEAKTATPVRDQPAAPPAEDRGPQWRHARVEEALASAQSLIAQNQVDLAVATLHGVLCLAEGGECRRVRLLLARAYLRDSLRVRSGLALLEEAIREHPSDAEALTILGTTYFRQGLLARAEANLTRAVAADPGNAAARSALSAVRTALANRRVPAENAGRFAFVGRLLGIER